MPVTVLSVPAPIVRDGVVELFGYALIAFDPFETKSVPSGPAASACGSIALLMNAVAFAPAFASVSTPLPLSPANIVPEAPGVAVATGFGAPIVTFNGIVNTNGATPLVAVAAVAVAVNCIVPLAEACMLNVVPLLCDTVAIAGP